MNYIQYHTSNRIACITLNRPDKRNALNHDMVSELKQAFNKAEKDDAAKVIVLKANGNTFSAGADLQYLQTLQSNSFEENLADSSHLMELFRQIYEHPKIIIAQVEGHAIAGGCGLVTVCDFAFAVPEANFGYTEVKIGFVPAIVSFFLLRKTTEAVAKELLLTGETFDAEKAKEYGIITQTSFAQQIEQDVQQFAAQLCKETSADSLRITKQMIGKIQSLSTEEALKYAAEQNAKARETDDCKAGISGFLKKEPVKW